MLAQLPAGTQIIQDDGLNIVGVNVLIGAPQSTGVFFPGLTNSILAFTPTASNYLPDGGLFQYGVTDNGAQGVTAGGIGFAVLYIHGLTTSTLDAAWTALGSYNGPSSSIFDEGLNIIGQNDPINRIVSIPTVKALFL